MEKIIKKNIKKLKKTYNKQLNKISKDIVNYPESLLDYFVIYLHYIRDLYLLKVPLSEKEVKDTAFLTLEAALAEFDNYLICVSSYFIISAAAGETLKELKIDTEDLKEHQKELQEHWAKFWALCKGYFNKWLDLIAD